MLRRELALRIVLQNLLLIASLCLFSAFAIVVGLRPDTAWIVCVAHGMVGLAAALQWCHHGIRTKQIKDYLLTLTLPDDSSWERWLPNNRPRTLLGSRWMISTKGVFIGLQAGMVAIAGMVRGFEHPVPFVLSVALVLATAGFLLTNPKE